MLLGPAKWTPSGLVKLTINNPEAFNQFEAGKVFFVDFSPAPRTEGRALPGHPLHAESHVGRQEARPRRVELHVRTRFH